MGLGVQAPDLSAFRLISRLACSWGCGVWDGACSWKGLRLLCWGVSGAVQISNANLCQSAQLAQLASPAGRLAQLQPARVTCMRPHWRVMHGQACVACAVESNNVMFVCAHVPLGMAERGLPREDPGTNSWGLGAPGPRGAPLAVEEQP